MGDPELTGSASRTNDHFNPFKDVDRRQEEERRKINAAINICRC